MASKHANTDGGWAVPDDVLGRPQHRDECLDCGVSLGAQAACDLDALRRAHGATCSRRCVVEVKS